MHQKTFCCIFTSKFCQHFERFAQDFGKFLKKYRKFSKFSKMFPKKIFIAFLLRKFSKIFKKISKTAPAAPKFRKTAPSAPFPLSVRAPKNERPPPTLSQKVRDPPPYPRQKFSEKRTNEHPSDIIGQYLVSISNIVPTAVQF